MCIRDRASIDGATAFQKLRYITLPRMLPSISINLLLNLSQGLKAFDIVYVCLLYTSTVTQKVKIPLYFTGLTDRTSAPAPMEGSHYRLTPPTRTSGPVSYTHLSPVGMAYVPWTRWEETYDVHKALMTGTIFPSLDKPWCGMRGGRG